MTTRVGAQGPVGGQPAPDARQSVADLDEQVAYQRAFEAVLWAMPASAIYRFRVGLLEQPGMADNVITAFSGPLHTFHELITPNQVTPYIGALADLRKGPVVLEVPAKTAKGVLYGQVVDAWQATIADIGPSGLDKGAGGKYLFLPPAYKAEVPKPFNPPEKLKSAMEKGVVDAYYYMQNLDTKLFAANLYWPDRHWNFAMVPDAQRGFDFVSKDAVEIDKRAAAWFFFTFYPQELTDRATWAFVRNPLDRAGLGSFNLNQMKTNADGSVDLYVGPNAPAGLESNWIPTMGKEPYLWFRLYAPEEAFWNKSFKMPDVELVK